MGEGTMTRAQVRTDAALEADGRGVVLAPGARLVDASHEGRAATGSDDFPDVFDRGIFVDKSLLVRDVLSGMRAVLFCRPRRFGKTLAMSMLQDFLECAPCADPAARSRFELLDIWEADGGRWREHQGRYPVVALSLKGVSAPTWEGVLGEISDAVAAEFRRHRYLLEEGGLYEDERAAYARVLSGGAGPRDLSSSLLFLTELLHRRHEERAVVLVDEYDAPITHALAHGFYREAVDFMRGFLTNALKSNPHLEKGVLTGVQRVSKESIFSGLNNVKVNTPLNQTADERFGFTQAEVEALASYLGHPESVPTLKEWYDGYRFGEAEIYNPWSVLSFFDCGREAQLYWTNTSGNSILGEALASPDEDVVQDMVSLLEPGATVTAAVDPNVAYGELADNPGGVWSVLYMSGYLTTEDTESPGGPPRERPLRVPNREVLGAYRGEVVGRAIRAVGHAGRPAFHRAVAAGDEAEVLRVLGRVALNSASSHDLTAESPCHMLLLGLLYWMRGYRDPVSNREAGLGRFDVQVAPEAPSAATPALTFEVKFAKGAGDARLEALAREGLAQIESRAYDAAFEGSPRVRWGVAFSGKRVAVACERLGF
jgi:hypothetical protein